MTIVKLIRFLIILLLSLFLAACRSDSPNDRANDVYGDLENLDPSGALVVYWHSLTGADEARLLDLIDDFNASNEWRITVVGEYQGDLETLYERVVAGLSTGQTPDLVLVDPGLAAAYAAQDAAVALSPYLESRRWGFTQVELGDFFPSALTTEGLPQFKNRRFSFPTCRSLQVLYYNADWLKELDSEGPPQTWEAFREMACAASVPADGLFGYEAGVDSLTFLNMLAAQGAPMLNQDATAYTLGGEVGQATLQFLQDLIQDGCAQWETEQGPLEDFGVGEVLFTIGSTDDLPAYQRVVAKEANFDWALSPLPYTTQAPIIGVYGTSLALLRSSPREQLATWLFIKWLAEPEQQARWAQEAGCFPTRSSALELMQDYLETHPFYAQASELLTNEWVTEPGVTAYGMCRAEIGRMLYAVTAGESVASWLSDTLNRCNEALVSASE